MPGRLHLGAYDACEFYVYRHLDEIAGLWSQLERSGTYSPFQSLAWAKALVDAGTQHAGERQQSVFVVGFVGAKPVVILPFTLQPGILGMRLAWLGEKMSDYNGMIVDRSYAAIMPRGLICRVVTMLRVAFPVIQAVHLIRNPVGRFDMEQTREPGATVTTAEFKSHAVTLEKDWEKLYAGLRSGKSRQRLRSKLRSLAKQGEVRFRQVRDHSERAAITRRILDWKAGQLSANGYRNPFGSADSPSSVRKAIEGTIANPEGSGLRVFAMFLDGKPVAGMLAFITRDTFYYFVSAYAPELNGKYSIGVQLLVKTLELAARSQLKRYDFLIGDEPYKTDWCDTEIPLVNYSRPFSLRGRLICAGLAIRLAGKKLILSKVWLNNFARWMLKARQKPDKGVQIRADSLVLGLFGPNQSNHTPQITTAKYWPKTPEDA